MISGIKKLVQAGYLLAEIASLIVAFIVAHMFRGVSFSSTQGDKIFLYFGFLLWALVRRLFPCERVCQSFISRFVSVIRPVMLFSVLISMIGFFFKEADYSRLVVIYFVILHAFFVWFMHSVGDHLMRASVWRKYMLKRLCLLRVGVENDDLEQQISNHPEHGYTLVSSLNLNNLRELGAFEYVLAGQRIDEVVVKCSHEYLSGLDRLIRMCDFAGIRITILPELSSLIQLTMTSGNFLSNVAFRIREVPLDQFSAKITKRVFDILFSFIIIVVLSPVFLVCGILIKLSSPGPIFFKQTRTGYGQREFICYKFRSMRVTDPSISESRQATKDDPRMTWIGEFIRRTNIDELPQFINVLKGDMSVVGPRPHMLKHTKEFSEVVEGYLVRHFVRPGITGWAQVNGWRGPTDTEWKIRERVEHDLWYVENWSFGLDLRIVLLTVFGKKTKENAF